MREWRTSHMKRDEGMTLEYARGMAGALVDLLSPVCVRIEIAGSVRRQKPRPNDIELVMVPCERISRQPSLDSLLGLGKLERTNLLDARCDELLKQGILEKRPDSRGRHCWGTGVKRAVFFQGQDYAPVDLFQVIEPRQWGVIYAIRTGPGDFNRLLVTSQWFGGACPKDWKAACGRVWFIDPNRKDLARMPATKLARLAERERIEATMISTPEGEDFFRQLCVPCWPPEERTERRVMRFIRQWVTTLPDDVHLPIYRGR
jgi:DNA polymerase/3'-5' exonuclease PolX